MQNGCGVYGMVPSSLMNLEVEVRPRGLRIARVTDVSDDLTGSYARSIAHASRVSELRIPKIVLRPGVVVVQMVIKVLIAVVAAQKHRVALPNLRSLGRYPIDRTVYHRENRRPFRAE